MTWEPPSPPLPPTPPLGSLWDREGGRGGQVRVRASGITQQLLEDN